MNWLRLLEIIESARQRVTTDPKRQNGYQWVCYCRVCCDLRAVSSVIRTLAETLRSPDATETTR